MQKGHNMKDYTESLEFMPLLPELFICLLYSDESSLCIKKKTP